MIEFLKNSVEFHHWGWNVQTIGAIGTLICTVFQGWGFWKQSNVIWEKRSGESVSVPMTGFWLVYFCAFVIYAVSVPSIAMTANCLLGIPIAVATLGLWRYKKRLVKEWGIVFLCTGFIPAMLFLPKKTVLIALYVPAYAFLVHQGYEVWKNGVGVLNSTFVAIFLATGFSWLVFTAATGQWIIFIFNCLAGPVWVYILWKWYRTRVVL